MQSAETITVEHAGIPVWIDYVDEHNRMARIHTEGNPEESKTVSVSELVER